MANEREAKYSVHEELERLPDEGDDRDIQELLDIGYNQLDGFVNWLEEHIGLDARTAQQDCFNAESLVDYLANYQHKEAANINEFDIRWFLFSHYIRKVHADKEIEERLPDSLQRFFHYLQVEQAATFPDWLADTLEDQAYYLLRRETFSDLSEANEREWKEGFRDWCATLEDDLDTRCLWLPNEMGNGLEWSDRMGWRESTLRDEANQVWQTERAELLLDGLDYESVRERLGESYLIWLDTPQERLEDQTPREVILEERSNRVEEVEEDED